MSMGIGTNARKPDEGKLKRDDLGDCLRSMVYEHRDGNAQDDQIPG